MTYVPRPQTIAHYVVTHLASIPAGKELTTTQLCEAIGIDRMALTPFMKKAIEVGLVHHKTRDGLVYWSWNTQHPPIEDKPKTFWQPIKKVAPPEPDELTTLREENKRLRNDNEQMRSTLETIARMAKGNIA